MANSPTIVAHNVTDDHILRKTMEDDGDDEDELSF